MQAKAKTVPEADSLSVKKRDLINAWLVLEKLVVSLDKIGSAYATPSEAEFSEQRAQEMYAEVGRFVTDNILNDANRYRIPLGNYLPNDEAETLSDEVEYWKPSKP
jgi:hypothetical protein